MEGGRSALLPPAPVHPGAHGHILSLPSFALVGAGDRGRVYSSWVERHPGRARILALAEPDEGRRGRYARRFGLAASGLFPGWRELLARERLADGLIIATQDADHVEPALAALAKGYTVLLEKPMALTEADARRLVAASEAAIASGGGGLFLCHVLRSHPFFRLVKELVAGGAVGEPASIRWNENVSYWHFAHSYVRGAWRDPGVSPMILAKCSHDLDLLYWLAGRPPRRVASLGGNLEFRPERAPPGAPERCAEGCPAATACPYDAVALYLRGTPLYLDAAAGSRPLTSLVARFMARSPGLARLVPGLRPLVPWRGAPVSAITDDLTDEGILRALREGPYGLCAYRASGGQPDHQETIIEFEGGLTAFLSMHGHSYKEGRTIRVDGTRGSLRGSFGGGGGLELREHKTGGLRRFRPKDDPVGHEGADMALMEGFVAILAAGKAGSSGLSADAASLGTGAAESLTSHRLAWAADLSRREGRMVELD